MLIESGDCMYQVKHGRWDQLQQDAKLIRTQVFICEQGITEADEWDDQDQPIATARLLQNHSVGRVAVVKAYRGQGLGQMIMLEIISYAQKQGLSVLTLSSQVHAISFYEKLGFTVQGNSYDECGISHIEMTMNLNTL